jgi:deoxyribodipyrimidine photo-lyase
MTSTALVCFRRDLRLADHPALATACARHDAVLPVYIHAPDEEGEWAPGGAQRWWLHHSLTALDARIADAGNRLVVRTGPTDGALAALLEETGAEAVYWNRLYELAIIDRDRRIKAWLRDQRGVTAESFNAALLFEPWTVATGQGAPYRVFTPFWRRLQREGLPDQVAAAPDTIPAPSKPPASAAIAELDLLPRIRWDAGLAAAWTPGESDAQARLAAFLDDGVASYREERERPAVAGTSGLSPHLHFGEIGPRQIVRAVRANTAGGDEAAGTYLSEIAWREFSHHLLYHFPHIPDTSLDPKFATFPWRDAEGDAAPDLAAWQAGRTGIPLVDAGMRELWRTGWMHNRLRMVVASFLTKNLRLHWLHGARWFWDTLVDADLANNTQGWQWAAGCGADAAPYFRIFNPVRQGERFDPDGSYVRYWVPEVAALPDRHVHAPFKAPERELQRAGLALGRDYPEPIVDLAASRRTALDAFETIKKGQA